MSANTFLADLFDSELFVDTSASTYLQFKRISQDVDREADEAVQTIHVRVPPNTSGTNKVTGLRVDVDLESDNTPSGGVTGVRAIHIPEINPSDYSYLTTMAIRINQGWETSLRTPDDCDLMMGYTNDAGLRWSTDDDTATGGSLVMFLGNDSQTLHITDRGARETDWDYGDHTHPRICIHSNTTPATDYLVVGAHDGTSAEIDVVGGTTLNFKIAGSVLAAMTATAFTYAATCFPVLPVTDTDGTVEGSIWYDASEEKLKFKTSSGVETVTSA